MVCPSLLSAIQYHCRVSAWKYQLCMFGDDAFYENSSVTAVLKHTHESDRKKNSPKILLSFFSAHWVNYRERKKSQVFRNYRPITEKQWLTIQNFILSFLYFTTHLHELSAENPQGLSLKFIFIQQLCLEQLLIVRSC